MERTVATTIDLLARAYVHGRASAGDVLCWRRKQAGLSLPQIARADGRWTAADVAAIEASRTPSGPDVARYLRALEHHGAIRRT